MDRSIYPDGVTVNQADLTRTENTKAYHIRRRLIDLAVDGIVSGFEVSVVSLNAVNVDVALGTGYWPIGEYLELAAPQLNIGLSDNSVGSINYIVAVYKEISQTPQTHETENRTEYTEVIRSIEVKAYSQAEFFALDLTNDDYTVDALDRLIIVGRVTGNGNAVALTNSNITNATEFSSHITIEQPTTITGTNLIGISTDHDTSLEGGGAATLAFD
mgnify:CR=1 FL=1